MLNNVKDFGAVGDGNNDDREAIQAAIDDAKNDSTKQGIIIPVGTYAVSRAGVDARWSLTLSGVQDFVVAGMGPGSIICLQDANVAGRTNWHVFILHEGCQRVVFQDLVIDGNRDGLVVDDVTNEQFHGIDVLSVEDLVIDRCTLRNCVGDGIRFVGQSEVPDATIKRVHVENCLFQSNVRSGIVVQRGIEQMVIANTIFDSTIGDQTIDFEPSGGDESVAPMNIVIQGCLINHINHTPAVTLSGINPTNPSLHCKFNNNLVLGGAIFCAYVSHLTIQNNTVRVVDRLGTDGQPAAQSPVFLRRSCKEVVISDNLLIDEQTYYKKNNGVITLSEAVDRVMVSNNLCLSGASDGIVCLSGEDITIQGNKVIATGNCKQGIRLRSQISSLDKIVIRNNDISIKETGTWEKGMQITAHPNEIQRISIVGNFIDGATLEGIVFDESNFQQTPIFALNQIEAATPLHGLGNLPEGCVVSNGNIGVTTSSGIGRFVTGEGDPNNQVTGNVGDIFQRLDGGVGSTLYIKETGHGTQTGWSAK